MRLRRFKKRLPFILLIALTLVAIIITSTVERTTIVYSLGIGYLSSVVFYFVVVYLPERKRQKDVSPYVFEKVEIIISLMCCLIEDILNVSKKEYSFKTLKENELMEACKAIDPKEHETLFLDDAMNNFRHHFGYKCYNDWIRISSNIEDLSKFFLYMDTGLIFHLSRIKQSHLSHVFSCLKNSRNLKNESMEAYAEELYKIYTLSKELHDYYVIELKKELRNDRWAS